MNKFILIFLLFTSSSFSQSTFVDIDDFETVKNRITLDFDGDNKNWGVGAPPFVSDVWQNSNKVAFSNSFDINVGPLFPDNILALGPLDFSSITKNIQLNWISGTSESTEGDNYQEFYSVYLLDNSEFLNLTSNSLNLKTPLFSGTLPEGNSMISNSAFISDFKGKSDLYLIFRHHNCSDELSLYIDDIYMYVDDNLNTPENFEQKVKIYPTITNNLVYLFSEEVIISVEIFNHFGQISQVINQNNIKEINFDNFEEGIYFVKIKSNNHTTIKKIIKI